MSSSSSKPKIAIVGAGLVGKSWATIFSRAGYRVTLYDQDAKQVDGAMRDIRTSLTSLKEAGLLPNDTVQVAASRISSAATLADAVRDAVYVQECVPEVLAFKQKVSQSINDALVSVGNTRAVVGSSTSGITASLFTESLSLRTQFLVAHPVNPPFAIPVVELVPAPWTSASSIAFARQLMKDVGQSPITLKKEIDGFALNRLQYALMAEAYRLVEDGVCSVEDVDTAVHSGLALRWSFMGPFQTIDLNAPNGVLDYCERYIPTIEGVVKSQDNTRTWKPETIRAINDAMRKEVPLDQLKERALWRNRRLVALAVHKKQEEEAERRRQAPVVARSSL